MAQKKKGIGQDLYEAAQSGYQNSQLHKSLKPFRDAGGTEALDDIANTIINETIGKNYKNPVTGEPENILQHIRGKISSTKTAKKNKELQEEKDKNEALAQAIAKALADELKKSGPTP